MDYVEYFLTFMDIEQDLLSFVQNMQYTEESGDIYTPKLSLLLLQTCPLIESYMIKLALTSRLVTSSDLYNWELNWKLWEKKDKCNEVKESNGLRSIKGFSKFSFVCETIFELSNRNARFYYTDKYIFLHGNASKILTKTFQPYKSLGSYKDYRLFNDVNSKFPMRGNVPKWWTAYNKVKHRIESAKHYVNYNTVIEAISALFILLCCCDVDTLTLQNNFFLRQYGNGSIIKTKLFEFER